MTDKLIAGRPFRSALLLIGFLSAEAFAMHITQNSNLVAWSSDGRSALIEQRERGPEGGGSLTYLLLSGRPVTQESFPLSSDFSNGASTIERITVDSCQSAAESLARRLEKEGFTGISVEASRCQQPGRSRTVNVSSAAAELVQVSRLAAHQGRWNAGPVELRADAGKISLWRTKTNQELASFKTDASAAELIVSASPSQQMILVFKVMDNFGSRPLVGAFVSEGSDYYGNSYHAPGS
jgi:hypothetical protein